MFSGGFRERVLLARNVCDGRQLDGQAIKHLPFLLVIDRTANKQLVTRVFERGLFRQLLGIQFREGFEFGDEIHILRKNHWLGSGIDHDGKWNDGVGQG